MCLVRIGSIVIRCFEFEKMYEFWKEALHYVPKYPPENGWVILTDPTRNGPNISLDKTPAKRTGKRGWIHLDLYTEDQEAEVTRLLNIGAKKYPWRYPAVHDYIVLEDPDGNLFCVVQT